MESTVENLSQGYDYWREQVAKCKEERDGTVYGFHHDKNGFRAWERVLCESFLSFSPENRERLPELVCDWDILWLLNGYPLLLAKEVKTSTDEHLVMIGLAALLIVDGRVELREVDHSARTLFGAAWTAAIDVKDVIRKGRSIAVSDTSRQWLDGWNRWEPQVHQKPAFRIEDELAKSALEHASGARVYYFQAPEGNTIGPLTARALRECRYRGIITAKTKIRAISEQDQTWKPASEFLDIVPRLRE